MKIIQFLCRIVAICLISCSPDDVVKKTAADQQDGAYNDSEISQQDEASGFPSILNQYKEDQKPKVLKQDIDTLSNGVRIRYLQRGAGASPVMGDVVEISFAKRPLNGKVYDASSRNPNPVAVMLGLDMILEAWQLAILEMKEGDSAVVVIPSSLAYGSKGLAQLVPPDTDLEIIMRLKRIVLSEKIDNDVLLQKFFDAPTNEAQEGQQITMAYFAFRKNGTMYDASARNSAPFTFRVGQANMMPGLQDAIVHLSEGDWAYISIPSARAYGAKGLHDLVPPNTDVVYMVQVVKVE